MASCWPARAPRSWSTTSGRQIDGSGQRRRARAARWSAEIAEAGGKAIVNGADISDFAAAEGLIESAIEQFGRLDVLVNVAGILRDRMVFNMTEQEWDDVIRVHLKGTFNTTKFASAHWRSLRDETAQNRIINFTSVSGLHGAPGQPNYAAAKMGIVGLTYSSANSLAKYGVTVNAISPGAATRMTDSVPDRAAPGRARVGTKTSARPTTSPRSSPTWPRERSGWITGRVIHSMGYEVSLYNNPEPVSRIIGTGPWDAPTRSPTRSSGRSARSSGGTRDPGHPGGAGRRRSRSRPRKRSPTGTGRRRASCGSSAASTAARPYFYPRPICPSCGSGDVEWFTASGRATLYSYVINHRPAPGFEADAPYAIAVVQLAEGPRMMTNLVGVDPTPEALQLDMELRVVFERRGEVCTAGVHAR